MALSPGVGRPGRILPSANGLHLLKRLWNWKLLERQLDRRGLLLYRISERGQARLDWLREHTK
jgi:hypothetical protein